MCCEELPIGITVDWTTPANPQPGDKVIISPSVSDEEAKKRPPGGSEQPRPHIRLVRQANAS